MSTARTNTPSKYLLLLLTLLLIALPGSPVHAQDREALEAALRSPQRDLSDRMRDATRKPIDVLEFLGVRPGMHVLDVYAAGGYFTHVLALAVGEDGRVYAQNTPRGLRFEEDRSDITQGEALAAKIENNNLTNVIRVDRAVTDMNLPDESMDVILLSQIFHDYYNGNPARARNLLRTLMAALKPGGVLGLIDHAGQEGLDNRRLHRIPKADVIAAAQQAGFIVDGESDLLASPTDNYRRSIFDPMLNRTTDQFLLRLRKP